MKNAEKKTKFHYPVFAQRLAEEIIFWLKSEREKYDSWNLFFREIKKRYEQKD